MRRSALLLPVFAALSLTLGAQEVRQQGTAMTLPAFTDSQRWQSASGNLNAVLVASIAHAKSLGATAGDFGSFTGRLAATGWGPPNSGTALQYVRGLADNFASYPRADVQVIAMSDTSASLRLRRSYYLPLFGPTGKKFGVTVDEYEQATKGIIVTIAQYLGLRSSMQFEGEWATVTVTGRGSAAPSSAFSTGTYTATFGDSIVNTNAAYVGAWEVTYMPNGRHVIRHNGLLFIAGEYAVTLDQITFQHDSGPQGAGCPNAGAYRWMVDPLTKEIHFERLADECVPRVEWLTNLTLKRN